MGRHGGDARWWVRQLTGWGVKPLLPDAVVVALMVPFLLVAGFAMGLGAHLLWRALTH